MVAVTIELRRALDSGELRGRLGPRLFHLHGYARGVTVDTIGPSSRHEVAGSGGNAGG